MDQLLSGMSGTACYLDDIYVASPTKKLLLESLTQILDRLHNTGMRIQKPKCCFFQKKITFLGHVINEEWLYPTTEHLQAIKQMVSPTNVTELVFFSKQ